MGHGITPEKDSGVMPSLLNFTDAHGVNPRVSLGRESHFGPVRYEWLYRIAPKIIEMLKSYHDDNVGTQLAGNDTV